MNAGQIKSVFLTFALLVAVSACGAESKKKAKKPKANEVAPGVLHLGRIAHPHITESSGVVVSRQFPGVFWTHNDGGGGRKQVLYGMTREGKPLAELYVSGALLLDWEDIAIDGEHHLFIGDIGNNDAKRAHLAVHQIDEPDPKADRSEAPIKRSWQLHFPAAPFDCESLFIWRDHGYVISKVFNDQRAEIYRFPLTAQKEPFVLEFVARLKIDSPVTGADISADGRLLGIVAHSGAFVYRIDGDVAAAAKLKPHHTKFKDEHIEGCCFVPEGLYATSESRDIYLFIDPAFHPAK